MTTIDLNNVKFDAIARAIQAQLVGAKSRTGKDFGFSKSRQVIAQSIFGKTYEEVVATGLLKEPPSSSDVAMLAYPVIMLLKYGDDYVLTLQGECVDCTATSILRRQPLSHSEIVKQASLLSEKHHVDIQHVNLPRILDPQNFTSNDVIELAKKMGFFSYTNTIFDLIEDNNTLILINGNLCGFTLNGNWEGEIEMEAIEYYESLKDISEAPSCKPDDFTVWNPDLEKHEYYFSFNNLCEATPLDATHNIWSVLTDQGVVHVTFKR